MTNTQDPNNAAEGVITYSEFVIRFSSFLRHSGFVIRHSGAAGSHSFVILVSSFVIPAEPPVIVALPFGSAGSTGLRVSHVAMFGLEEGGQQAVGPQQAGAGEANIVTVDG